MKFVGVPIAMQNGEVRMAVDVLPDGLLPGTVLRQGDLAWRVLGIDRVGAARKNSGALVLKPFGLSPVDKLPTAGAVSWNGDR